jgi:hypothetical protein
VAVSDNTTPRTFTQGNDLAPIVGRLGWSHGWCGRVRKIWTPKRFDPPTTQPVACPCTDCAIRPIKGACLNKFIYEYVLSYNICWKLRATLLKCTETKGKHPESVKEYTETSVNRFRPVWIRTALPKKRHCNFLLGKATFEAQWIMLINSLVCFVSLVCVNFTTPI